MSDSPMPPGLEYPLLFGLPENKTEILDGKMRVVWPFQDPRETARAFDRWCEELERWRDSPRVDAPGDPPRAVVGGIDISLYRPRVVEMLVPVDVDTFLALQRGFWKRELWDLPARPDEPGYFSWWRHGDVRMHLWLAFSDIDAKTGGRHCWGDVMLTEDTSLVFDLYYFAPDAPMDLIGGDFAAGVPRAIAQVVSPATREIDHGPRQALLHRAGVRHVWLLDPAEETVAVFAWEPAGYAAEGVYRRGDQIRPAFCPEASISVEQLFTDQDRSRPGRADGAEAEEQAESWLIDPERRVGLEHMLLLGHPARRYEIWRESSPCVLAFASATEARARLRHFLDEAARWAGAGPPAPLQLSDDVEAARVGGSQFTRRRNRVYLDVAVDPGAYRRMLLALSDREVWTEPEGG